VWGGQEKGGGRGVCEIACVSAIEDAKWEYMGAILRGVGGGQSEIEVAI